jgi:aspartate/methionine/tyrosine aminotransferase
MFTLTHRQAQVPLGRTGDLPGSDSLFVARVEFTRLSKEYDVVNLGQGFPDFSPPDFAVQAFQQATTGNFMLNQYTSAFVSLLPLLKVLGH